MICEIDIPYDDRYDYLVEYRGDIEEDLRKVDYACASIINDNYAVVSTNGDKENELIADIPSILIVIFRGLYVLQGTSAVETSNINTVKINPYLNLNGRGVLIGMIDTGIDYLNEEFIREDGTTRIEEIWDQDPGNISGYSDLSNGENIIGNEEKGKTFIGEIYNSDKINQAILVFKEGKNPYEIVPTKDYIGHGTEMASIIGARGYNKQIEGIANDCTFVVVKIRESGIYRKELRENNLKMEPVYNNTQLLLGLEYLRKVADRKNKPMIIVSGMGSSDHSHNGSDLFSRYVDELCSLKGISFISGCGNEGIAEGHVSGNIFSVGEVDIRELLVSKEMKTFSFRVWVSIPNKLAINIISPSGQESSYIMPKINQKKEIQYLFENTNLKIRYYEPEVKIGRASCRERV